MNLIKRTTLFALLLVLVLSFTAFAAQVQVTVLHTNDLHGHAAGFVADTKVGEIGGLARIETLINEIRAEQPNVILLDGGDCLHGTNEINVSKGMNMVALMSGMGYDAMVPGNHDFNYGYKQLLNLANVASFDILSANVLKDGENILQPYTLIEKGGYKFAIIGLSTQDTPIVTHPNNVQGLVFADPIATAKAMVAKAKADANFVIVLSHLGYEVDKTLAQNVPGIDLIVGGHSHTVLDKPTTVNGINIVQDGEWGKNLGRVDLTIEDGKITAINGKLIPVGNKVAKNVAVETVVNVYKAKLAETMNVVIGSSDVDLMGDRGQVRTRETNLADLIIDVMREATKADLAVTNGGGIRASIAKGDITVGSVYTVLPFDNTLVVMQFTGAQIRAALELSVSKYPAENGGFLQVSGLKFTFDPSKPAGQRIVEVTANGQPLDPNKTYVVATNDFTAVGGDGYTMFKDGKVLFQSGLYLRDVVVDYIKAQGNISSKTDGRITVKQ